MKKFIQTSLKELLLLPSDPMEKFHNLTKFKKWEPFLSPDKWPKSWKVVLFKEYPRLDKVFLPDPILEDSISLKEVLNNRKSDRSFSRKGLTLSQISNFLFFSAGMRKNKKPWLGTRFYPSPGGRYTLETYLISLNSELPKGVYHYNVRNHNLELLGEIKNFRKNYYSNQEFLTSASCLIFVTTVFKRNTIKYGIRGYRHILAESGHLGQNFYLIASALNLAICAIGGYVDDRINALLDIDGLNESIIYPLAIGNPLSSVKKEMV